MTRPIAALTLRQAEGHAACASHSFKTTGGGGTAAFSFFATMADSFPEQAAGVAQALSVKLLLQIYRRVSVTQKLTLAESSDTGIMQFT